MSTDILQLAQANQGKAWQIIKDTDIINIWESVGARINLVGSLKTGLLINHRDIDFHIYTDPFSLADSFNAIEKLAENPAIKRIEYGNLLDTDEECVEWHLWYQDGEGDLWQFDLIHIVPGSYYDGYFENVADRIMAVLTDETRLAILNIKNDTPETEKIIGIEYCMAVIRDGVRNYEDFTKWRKANPVSGVLNWIP